MTGKEFETIVSFTVHGEAQPRGSKQSYVPIDKRTGQPYRKNGRVIVSTVDDNPKSKGWMQEVKRAAAAAMNGRPLATCPVRILVVIRRVRGKSHFGSGRNSDKLKGSAPAHPATKPDLSKMIRGIEDAMTGIVYRDDAQIVGHQTDKVWGDSAGVDIEVVALPTTIDEAASFPARSTVAGGFHDPVSYLERTATTP